MKLGKQAMEALQAEVTGILRPGDELVVAGAAGLEGTEAIGRAQYAFLRGFFSEGFLYETCHIRQHYGIWQEGEAPKEHEVWKLAQEMGTAAGLHMGEGGFLCALWKMAEASQVGLRIDLRKIPIRQETIEVCEKFDLNPYRLLSGGAYLFGVPGGERLTAELRRRGWTAAVIGEAVRGNDRLLYSGENVRYLDRPAKDELYRCPGFEKK